MGVKLDKSEREHVYSITESADYAETQNLKSTAASIPQDYLKVSLFPFLD